MSRRDESENWRGHFADDLTPEAYDFIENGALLKSRYIFTERIGGKQYGYCTHCKATFPSKLRHGDVTHCPNCLSKCHVRAAGRGRKDLVDEIYLVWYEKSLIDQSAITARGVWAVRDYRHNYRETKTTTATVALYVFRPGKSVMFRRSFWFNKRSNSWWGEGPIVGDLYATAKVYSLMSYGMHSGRIPNFYNRDNLKKVVSKTQYRFSCWENYDIEDMTTFFALYSTAPCIEYLTKLRMKNLVVDKLAGDHTNGTINWRGKNLLSVLRMTKLQFNAIQASNVRVTYTFLAAFRDICASDKAISPAEAITIADEYESYVPDLINLAGRANTTAKRAAAWSGKQLKIDSTHFFATYAVLHTWKDYLDDCVKLRLDLNDEAVAMPKNLYSAHQRTIEQIKVKEDKALMGAFAEQAKKLAMLKFTAGGLFIIPPRTMKEIIKEGEALSHCVGGYSKRHATGETAILFIRRLDEPKTPFYTVEVRNKEIVQVRGLKNCNMTPEVRQFVEEFKAARLAEKPSRKHQQQTKIAALA